MHAGVNQGGGNKSMETQVWETDTKATDTNNGVVSDVYTRVWLTRRKPAAHTRAGPMSSRRCTHPDGAGARRPFRGYARGVIPAA